MGTTKTAGCTLKSCCECAIQFDNQHCGIYAGDWDCYKDFAEVFDAIIQEYHGISADAKHTSDMDVEKIKGNVNAEVPVHSTRVRGTFHRWLRSVPRHHQGAEAGS